MVFKNKIVKIWRKHVLFLHVKKPVTLMILKSKFLQFERIRYFHTSIKTVILMILKKKYLQYERFGYFISKKTHTKSLQYERNRYFYMSKNCQNDLKKKIFAKWKLNVFFVLQKDDIMIFKHIFCYRKKNKKTKDKLWCFCHVHLNNSTNKIKF